MNLAGVAAGMGNELPKAELVYQRIAEGRQRLALAARQQQQMEAWASTLQSPPGAALPQQGPPGMTLNAQRGSNGSYGVPGGGAPGVPGMPGTPSGPAASPGASPPSTMPATGGFQTPPDAAAGFSLPDPMVRLRQMMAQITRANPGIDKLTAFGALQQGLTQMKGLAPEERINMQLEMAQQKFQTTRDIAMLRDDLGRLQEAGRNTRADATNQTRENVAGRTNDTRLAIAGQTDDTRRRGQDISSGDRSAAEAGRNQRAATTEAGRNSRAAARIDASNASAQVKAQYKTLAAQRAAIKDKLDAFKGGVPGSPNSAEAKQLEQQLNQVNEQLIEHWKKNPGLPRPSEVVSADAAPGGGAPAPDAGGAPPMDASTLAEGTTASKGGVTFTVQSGKWVKQ